MDFEFTVPPGHNRQQLIEELRAAIGRGAFGSVTWGRRRDVLDEDGNVAATRWIDGMTLHCATKLTAAQRSSVKTIVAKHDGTLRNAVDAQEAAAAKQANADRSSVKRELRAKLEAGAATPAEIQRALAIALR